MDWTPISQGLPEADPDALYEIKFESGRVMPGYFTEDGFRTKEEGIVVNVNASRVTGYRLHGPSLKEDIELDKLVEKAEACIRFIKTNGRLPEDGKHQIFETAMIALYGVNVMSFIEKQSENQ